MAKRDMSENRRMSLAMGALRDQLVELINHHEARAHDAEPCLETRVKAIAFLADAIGLKTSSLRLIRYCMEEINDYTSSETDPDGDSG